MTRIKICGITNIEDALTCVKYGADALGFVFAKSPRQISPENAKAIIKKLPPFISTVGVFVNLSLEKINEIKTFCNLDVIQLHGDEIIETQNINKSQYKKNVEDNNIYIPVSSFPKIIKAVSVRKTEVLNIDIPDSVTLLLDTYSPDARGGTGKTFNWDIACEISKKRPLILAGGLNPDNIKNAVKTVNPYGVDVSSGVEKAPGIKDHDKLYKLINEVKY